MNIMNENDKITLLKYNISRFDHYYTSINFKSSFLILSNVTILGFVFSRSSSENAIFLILSALLAGFSIFFVLLAIKPFLKSYTGKNSILFFGDIKNQGDDFKMKIQNMTELNYVDDLINQNMILAQGLKYKFEMLNYGTIVFIIHIILFLGISFKGGLIT